MLTYRKLASRRDMTIFLAASLAFHLMLLLALKRNIPKANLEHIDEITFIDPTLPEGQKSEPAKRGLLDMFFKKEEEVQQPGPPPPPDAETPKGIDLTPKELDRSQAAIDLTKSETPDGMNEVIRVAKPGDSKSTQDILAQAPIAVSGGKSLDKGDFGGLFSSPGSGAGPALEIDQGKKVSQGPDELARAVTKSPQKEGVTAAPVAKASFSITGPLRDRKILSRVLPEYPEWAQQKGATAVVALHLSVDPDGTVQTSVFVEQTSGSGEWDQDVVNALRNWRFAALAPEATQEVQDGVITFRFTL
jgi:TonB family protein